MKFWLGIYHPRWLERLAVPVFVSRRVLMKMKRLPTATTMWALDSGGFSELTLYGEWRTSPQQYIGEIRRYRDEIGSLRWASPQDWMVEPFMLAKTGLTLAEHQRRTTENYLALRALDPDIPIIPVLQGQRPDEYLRHLDQYAKFGVDLTKELIVGLGSMCRRQRTSEAVDIVHQLFTAGVRLHGFGMKLTGLRLTAHWLESADSMAWSYGARRGHIRLDGCSHRTCANCILWALKWRDRVCASILAPKQERFPFSIQ